MKQSDEIRSMLNGKYDREALAEILGISKDKTGRIAPSLQLISKGFLSRILNDLQFLGCS